LFNLKCYLLEVVLLDRNMMLTPDEYMALMRLISSERESEGASLTITKEEPPKPRRRSRSARSQDKKLSQAFKEANRRYRKKDGSLRTGRTQADIARLAHKLRKKM
jgi:hypothetical protein